MTSPLVEKQQADSMMDVTQLGRKLSWERKGGSPNEQVLKEMKEAT